MTTQNPCEFVAGRCVNCDAIKREDCEGWIAPDYQMQALAKQVATLTAERDALRADALRYRWITKQVVEDTMEQLEKAFSVFDGHAETITQDEFDAAIDAGMKETQ